MDINYSAEVFSNAYVTEPSTPNVSCRLVQFPKQSQPELVLEVLNYDTLWQVYTFHILGVADNTYPDEEVQVLRYIASRVQGTADIFFFPGTIQELYTALPDIPTKHINNIVDHYVHKRLLKPVGDHFVVEDVLIQPLNVVRRGKGTYVYDSYDEDNPRVPLKVIYQADGSERI